ncbi:MAG: hypothetical protein HY684_07115, partial [Chloroflexi bacterium]|nr:hypothetical protein [Chloroflexota bacterium]
MVTETFREQAYTISRNVGVARQQVVVLPGDFPYWPEEQARAYAQWAVEELTQALTQMKPPVEKKAVVEETTELPPRVGLISNIEDLDRVQALFAQKQWTDGLPIVVPTEARVQAMMGAVQRQPSEVVGLLAP